MKILVSLVVFGLTALAQTSSVVGAVVKVDSGNLVLKPDTGAEVAIAIQPNANFRRIAPGETNLQKATAITSADIHPGDRVLARGTTPGSASLVVVMSQNDIAQKQEADRADWEKRGISGVVTQTAAGSLTVKTRTLSGDTLVTVTAAPGTIVRRYAPDSIRFADARPAKVADVKVGDQVRARGERKGDALTAEEIVTGTFRTLAATVASVNAAAGELQITDLETKKKLMVKLSTDTTLRKLAPQTAQAIAARVRPELAAKAKNDGKATPDFAQMMEKSPPITLADLKAGDALVISSMEGSSADRISAISVLAGVEVILTKPGTQEMSLGSWSIDLGGGVGQ